MPTIDLQAKIIPPTQNVWFVRPGKDYKLYQAFINYNMILADLPSLDLRSGVTLAQQPQLINRIHRSRAIRKWYRGDREDSFPSRNLNAYPDTVRDGGISQLNSVVERYFSEARRDDIVLVIPGAYTSDAYVGALTEDPQEIVSLSLEYMYSSEPLQGRRVEWLGKTAKKTLANPILEIAAKPNAFVRLGPELRRDIYELAYPGFVWGDDTNARFNVTSSEYTSYDDFLIQGFFNFVSSNTRAIAEGNPHNVQGFRLAAFERAGEYTPDLKTDINSPGYLNLSSTKVVPLVVAALFVAAVEIGPSAQPAAEAGTLRIGNSLAAADDACVAEVERLALQQLILLGADGWAEACEKARHSADRNGLRGPARVRR
ncbi:hypothetical protein MKK88_17640 [Methylobacterium sp. E-005]|uniref:hypothetical protein n=1 Tax=Methylobacterium sp. E-005 TaxID=2836549 RepID=UPI001FBC0F32|nr:hypothetical protein [Methylobacterium sp. E-005]MCJ2087789.1 hypothetical protein [Methylobacterium sp. E-005]